MSGGPESQGARVPGDGGLWVEMVDRRELADHPQYPVLSSAPLTSESMRCSGIDGNGIVSSWQSVAALTWP